MKRCSIIALISLLFFVSGCKPKHPSLVKIEPDFDPNDVGTILVAPVISSITDGEDPNRESEHLTNKLLWELLSTRADHTFLSPEQMRLAVQRNRLTAEYDRFTVDWATKHEADLAFLRKLKEGLNVDLILIPHVYLWFKDEADYREAATASSTQVGATLSLVDPASGLIVWEATDENFKESVRTEGGRSLVSAGGWDRRVDGVTETGRDMYAAPPFRDAAILVLEVLVGAIPEKGTFRQ